MTEFWIAFFALNIGVIAGFFIAAAMGISKMGEIHEAYERKWIQREKEHMAEVEFLKRKP